MSDDPALQGAINHVLRTAFKDVYAKANAGIPAKVSKQPPKIVAPVAPPTAEVPGQAPVSAVDDGAVIAPSGAGDVPSDVVEGGEEVPEVPEVELEPQAQDTLTQIDARVSAKGVKSVSLLHYLGQQQDRSRQQDEEEGDALKRQGLLPKAQLPLGPSHLTLDPQVLQDLGEGSTLLSAHDLVSANRVRLLRRCGLLPVVEGLKGYRLEDLLHVEPHYYLMTASLDKRKALTLPTSLGPHGSLSPSHVKERYMHQEHMTQSYKSKNQHVSVEQHMMDERLRQRTAAKLHYTGNPRYTQPHSHNRAYHRSLVAAVTPSELGYLIPPLPRGFVHHFSAAPSPLVFYECLTIDTPYHKTLAIRNVTGVTRGFSLLPPTTPFFTLVNVEYPTPGCRDVSPGLAAVVTIRFVPHSLDEYEDHLTLLQETGPLLIPLYARRERPCLVLSEGGGAVGEAGLDVGMTLIGDAKHTTFRVRNSGGVGRFRLLEVDDYPFPRSASSLAPVLRSPPFRLSPTSFELAKGQETHLHVDFIPTTTGEHRMTVLLLCDDCSLTEVTIRGITGSIDLSVTSLQGRAVDYDAIRGLDHVPASDLSVLDLGVVEVGSSATTTLGLHNRCATPLPFHWATRGEGEGPTAFSISPNTGVLGPHGSMLFTVTYTPTEAPIKSEACEMELRLLQVPPSSLPLEGQDTRLARLEARGRAGGCFRLENWMVRQEAMRGGRALMSKDELVQGLLAPLLATGHKEQQEEGGEGEEGSSVGGCRYGVLEVVEVLYLQARQDALQALQLQAEAARKARGRGNRARSRGEGSAQALGEGEERVDVREVVRALQPQWCVLLDQWLEHTDPSITHDPEPKEDVPCSTLTLRGSGKALDVALHPSGLVLDEGESEREVGVGIDVTVTLINHSNAPAPFYWALPTLLSPTASLLPLPPPPPNGVRPLSEWGACKPKAAPLVSVSVGEGVLPPLSSLPITVTVTPLSSGPLSLLLPCVVKGGYGPCRLSVQGLVKPPRVRFIDTAELDLGLLAVEGQTCVSLPLTNMSNAPLAWDLMVDPSGLESAELVETFRAQQQLAMLSTMLAGSTTASARSSARSSMSRATDDESAFGNKNAISTIVCEPENGLLEPGERAVVKVSLLGGRLSERIRGRLCCKVKDVVGGLGVREHFITYRAEVQELRVFLDHMCLDVGVCYVDKPVTRTLTLTNISNLTSAFKFERVCEGLGSNGFDVTMTPAAGSLAEKQSIQVTVVLTARRAGVCDELVGCRITGMTHPLGFRLKALGKGVVVAFDTLHDAQPLPRPLASENDAQLPEGVLIPSAEAMPTLQCGVVPLFARRRLRFAIRNLSAVPASFKLLPRRFPAAPDKGGQGGGGGAVGPSGSGGKSVASLGSGSSEELVTGAGVSEERERMGAYASSAGKAHLTHKYHTQQDRLILSEGNGLALVVRPCSGVLVPWGVVEVSCDVYNNMPGTYADELQALITGAPPCAVPVRAIVQGCPLALKTDTLGLDATGGRSGGNGLACLRWGDVCVGSKPITKTITVLNNGPTDATLHWKVLGSSSRQDDVPLCRLSLTNLLPENDEECDWGEEDDTSLTQHESLGRTAQLAHPHESSSPRGAGKAPPPLSPRGFPVSVSSVPALSPRSAASALSPRSPRAPPPRRRPKGPYIRLTLSAVEPYVDPNWSLHPPVAKVRAFRSSTFHVTLRPPPYGAAPSPCGCKLVLDAEWHYSKAQLARVQGSSGGRVKRTPGALRLLTDATLVLPHVLVDKRVHGELHDSQWLKWEVPAHEVAALSKPSSLSKAPLASCLVRSFSLTNPLAAPLSFTLHASAPFALLSVTQTPPLAPHLRPKSQSLSHGKKKLPLPPTARTYTLTPQESVLLEVAFLPPPLPEPPLPRTSSATKLRHETLGCLTLAYSTGQQQHIELRGLVLRPCLIIGPCDYTFGPVHVESSGSLLLFLCNPTLLDAHWSIENIPCVPPKRLRPGAVPQPWADPNEIVPVDDPSVFVFKQTRGVQKGPSLPLRSSGAILPQDYNRSVEAVWSCLDSTVSWQDHLTTLSKLQADNEDPHHRFSRPVEVLFRPKLNQCYQSRFRFKVQGGEGFDVLLAGQGTYQEDTVPNPPPHI